jgi:hypothetical protein
VRVIKGESMMPPLEGFALPEEVTIAAIPCGQELAIASTRCMGPCG